MRPQTVDLWGEAAGRFASWCFSAWLSQFRFDKQKYYFPYHIHSTPRLVICLRSILILSFHLRPGVLIFYFLEFYWNFVCKIYWALIIIIILVITLMKGIYNYIPETNHVSSVYSVAAVLYLQFILPLVLFCPWNLFCTFTLALSAVCVQCPKWLLSVVPEFRALRYCVSDYEMVPVAPFIGGITFSSTFHMLWSSIIIIIIIIRWYYSPMRTFSSLMDFSQSAQYLTSYSSF